MKGLLENTANMESHAIVYLYPVPSFLALMFCWSPGRPVLLLAHPDKLVHRTIYTYGLRLKLKVLFGNGD